MPLRSEEAASLLVTEGSDLLTLLKAATELNDHARPDKWVTYSRKAFIPLTNLCMDRCGYCTFVKGPRQKDAYTMSPEDVLRVVRRASTLGCKEVLISLGDHPERRHPEMAELLHSLGFDSTPEYVAYISRMIVEETGLLPHTNCGTLDGGEIEAIARWNVSMGLMLESTSIRLHERGEAHYGTETKLPEKRFNTLILAARHGVAMTTGILIGIGENVLERAESLIAIERHHEEFGNIQEVIIQNFRAKRSTRMHKAEEPTTIDMMRTLAVARLVFGARMNIQAPPNLNADAHQTYLLTGMNDWGGISPLTKDFINPEAAWPQVSALRRTTDAMGFALRERTALYPEYVQAGSWVKEESVVNHLLAMVGEDGYVRRELEQD